MTVDSFKKEYPEYAHLEGDALWDMMTNMFLAKGLNEEFPPTPKKEGKPPMESYRMTILDLSKYDDSRINDKFSSEI